MKFTAFPGFLYVDISILFSFKNILYSIHQENTGHIAQVKSPGASDHFTGKNLSPTHVPDTRQPLTAYFLWVPVCIKTSRTLCRIRLSLTYVFEEIFSKFFFEIFLENSPDCQNISVIRIGYGDAGSLIGCMYDLSVSNINSHMA